MNLKFINAREKIGTSNRDKKSEHCIFKVTLHKKKLEFLRPILNKWGHFFTIDKGVLIIDNHKKKC